MTRDFCVDGFSASARVCVRAIVVGPFIWIQICLLGLVEGVEVVLYVCMCGVRCFT